MKPRIRALTPLIAAGLLAGCFGSRTVKLPHQPAAPHAVADKGSVAMTPFTDARSPDIAVGSQIGQMRDSEAVPFMKLVTDDSPVQWFEDGFARALTEAGFHVERVDGQGAAGPLPVISGSVKEIFADKYFRMEAWLLATLSVERDDEVVFSTECAGRNTGFSWTTLDDEVNACFTAAMDELIADCVPKLAPYLTSSGAETSDGFRSSADDPARLARR